MYIVYIYIYTHNYTIIIQSLLDPLAMIKIRSP